MRQIVNKNVLSRLKNKYYTIQLILVCKHWKQLLSMAPMPHTMLNNLAFLAHTLALQGWINLIFRVFVCVLHPNVVHTVLILIANNLLIRKNTWILTSSEISA